MVTSLTLPNGVTLEYIERGKTSGIPVIFLRGMTDSCRSFDPLLDRLPDALHAFALTQRGPGRSSKPQTGYHYSEMAEDLRGFMDALDLPSAVIVGHSMGSTAAQRFAASHPDRVAGLVLMGAVPMDFTRELAAFHAPTLIAWGDSDTNADRADQDALLASIPRSRLLVYGGAGHAFHCEDPDRFAADLVAFIYERRVS
jgi:pimeloyl-ACP methyl ester carboxylesterase